MRRLFLCYVEVCEKGRRKNTKDAAMRECQDVVARIPLPLPLLCHCSPQRCRRRCCGDASTGAPRRSGERREAIPTRCSDSQLVVLFLWSVPLETTPLLFCNLDSQRLAFPFSFRLLVRPMMTTKVVFHCGSTCAFQVYAVTWPGVLRYYRVGRPEPSPDSVGCPVSVCRPKTV